MPAMLRQKGTGDLYIYTELMAARDDMEPVDEPDIGPGVDIETLAEATPKPAPKPRTTKPRVTQAVPVLNTADMFGDEE